MSQLVDDRIISKIHQPVSEGVRDIREMERHIKIKKRKAFVIS